MARLVLFWFSLLALPGLAVGQRPQNPLAPNPKFEPDRLLVPPPPDGVEDLRPYLGGQMPKIDPKGMDPKVLKELMDKLQKMPKDQRPDEAQIKKMLQENPAFKDPEFLKQLEKMLQDPNFPKNLEGKLPKDVDVPPLDEPEGGPQGQV